MKKAALTTLTIALMYWFAVLSPWAFFSEEVARSLDTTQNYQEQPAK